VSYAPEPCEGRRAGRSRVRRGTRAPGPTAARQGARATAGPAATDLLGLTTNVAFRPNQLASSLLSLNHALATQPVNYAFTYTPAHQIATASSSNIAYDWQAMAGSSVNIAPDGLNRDATVAAVTNGYDGDGNLTFDGTRTFTYDSENRLTGDSVGGSPVLALAYDPLGRLQQTVAGSTTTQYLYDDTALVAELSGGAIVQRFVHGPGVDNPVMWFADPTMTSTNVSYLIADRQGSIVATTNAAGTVTNVYTYDPYGNPSNWAVPGFGYTGQLALPQAQLWYYKARAYDPVAGRFLQTDPIGYTGNPDLYAYAADDPVDGKDPTGEATYYQYPNGTIVVVQIFDNHSQFSNSQIEAQAPKYDGKTSDGHNLVVQFRPGTGTDSVKINTNTKLDDTGSDRSHTDRINGRDVEVAPNAVGPITVGHELGHTLGAGDQYKGGIDANGHVVKDNVPGSEGAILRDYGGKPATQQTRDEIQHNATHPNNTIVNCSSTNSCGK
jgi:RHS repeat-associated protein